MARKSVAFLCTSLFLWLAFSSCLKLTVEEPPVANWEDFGSDSVRLNVFIRNSEGTLLTGQYVNLALSKDSLDNLLLVRKVITDGYGRASFPRLYPGKYFFNCFANYGGVNLIGSSSIFLPPIAKLDSNTILTVL
jgi:hypothetical protein